MKYCAIIGDIVGSKRLNERQKMQDRFKEVLNNANDKYDINIASNFTVTLGDEFQGLLIKPSMSIEIIQYIREKMYPVELVFGIGIGEMLTVFSKETSVGSDGPAYWFARKMVEKAKDKKPSIRIFSDSPEDELMNSLILFVEVCTHSQTNRQQEIVKYYKELGSQYTVAEKLGINQSAVSVALQKAYFKEIEGSLESIRHYLNSKWEENDGM